MTLHTGLATASPSRKLEAFFQIDAETQRRVGALIILFSMVEMQLEFAVWILAREPLSDQPISTDKAQASDLVRRLRQLAHVIDDEGLRAVLHTSLDIVDNLLVVRNTIAHGRPLGAEAGQALLARNASLLGEVRRREATTLVTDAATLDRVAEVADLMFRTVGRICGAVSKPEIARWSALELEPELDLAANDVAKIRLSMAG